MKQTNEAIKRDNMDFNSENCFTVKETLAIKALTFSWMPSWWKHEYGIIFGDKFIYDPDYRVSVAVKMERLIAHRFPNMHIGDVDTKPWAVIPNFINCTTVACAGGKVIFADDNYPASIPMPVVELEKLEFPEKVQDIFPYKIVVEQLEYLNKKYSNNRQPYFWKNGVMNDLVQLMGDVAFYETVDDTPLFRKLREYSLYMWMKTLDYAAEHNGLPEVVMLPNCTVTLIGPKLYEERIFETDMKIVNKFYELNQKFNLHHCGFFDPYVDIYRRFPHVDLVQIGFRSDPRLALDAFPEADVELIMDPYFFKEAPADKIRERVKSVLRITKNDWDRFSIALGDIDVGTPDENITALYECCKNI